MAEESLTCRTPQDWVGLRIDKALARHEKIATRSRAENLIEQKKVMINGKVVRSSYRLKINDEIHVLISSPPEMGTLLARDVDFEILYEDRAIMVINKPAGLVVHPAVGHQDDTLVNGLLKRSQDGLSQNWEMKFGEERPGIVHRLDKDTSGVLVVAKNDHAQAELSGQFKNRSVHRIYYAAVNGTVKNDSGTIQSFIARHPRDRQRMASVCDSKNKVLRTKDAAPNAGKWAVTHYKVLQRPVTGITYLQLKLETGRTHQIRVHLSELGHPIVSDAKYGAKPLAKASAQPPRFALHAAELGFRHPSTGESLFFRVPWPEDLRLALASLGVELSAKKE